MSRIAITPQRLVITAPQEIVLDVISTVGYECTPGSGRGVHLLNKDEHGVVVAFIQRDALDQRLTIKRVLPRPPNCVNYEHMSGLFAGAVEEILLKRVDGGTEVSLTAEFEPSHDTAPRVLKYMFETAALEHMEEIRTGAESRARLRGFTSEHPYVKVPVPVVSSESGLLVLAESQELAEWGHVGHGRGVARIAIHMAMALQLDARQMDELGRAARLHDVGKVALDSNLWGQLGVLSPGQRAVLEAHPRLGADMAARVEVPEAIQLAILQHHEHWDGQGYPAGLAQEAISLHARILCLAENVDAMMRSTYRREPLELDKMLGIIEEGTGREWDPQLVALVAPIIRGR